MQKNISERLFWMGLVSSFSVGCDQTTKRIAEQTLNDTSYSFFFDTIRLQFIKNSGAFLGFGSDFPTSVKFWLFLALPIIFLLGVLYLTVFSADLRFPQRFMLALIISGGVGNLIDRLLLSGHVTDFINVGIGSLRTGIFNIADVVLMIGAFGLLFFEISKSFRASAEKL